MVFLPLACCQWVLLLLLLLQLYGVQSYMQAGARHLYSHRQLVVINNIINNTSPPSPQGRGGSTGYDNAVALPARSDAEEFTKENVKDLTPLNGKIKMKVAAFNPQTGEIGGVFESIQPSDTDLGAKEPKDVKTVGLWYAQLS